MRSCPQSHTLMSTLQAAREADAGSYACTVSNAAGAATSQTALVTIQPRYTCWSTMYRNSRHIQLTHGACPPSNGSFCVPQGCAAALPAASSRRQPRRWAAAAIGSRSSRRCPAAVPVAARWRAPPWRMPPRARGCCHCSRGCRHLQLQGTCAAALHCCQFMLKYLCAIAADIVVEVPQHDADNLYTAGDQCSRQGGEQWRPCRGAAATRPTQHPSPARWLLHTTPGLLRSVGKCTLSAT
jgi:hypothetical protein